jgi:hypothetical protein
MSDRELLIKEFDEQIASGTLRIRMSRRMDPKDLSDEDKIKIMEVLKSEEREILWSIARSAEKK